jgi:hypothetical protein
VPLLVAAFTVARPEPLQPPRLEPSFDQTTAVAYATELARRFPDRSPGSDGSRAAAEWASARLRDAGLEAHRDEFTADVPGQGRIALANLVGVAPGRSPETIVVMAHRDNSGVTPGANDNASGTGALLELARNVQLAEPAHTLVFLSTDGGSAGGAGAARFARRPEILRGLVGTGASIVAVVNLDSLASRGPPRLVFAGDAARSPTAPLVATAADRVEAHTGLAPRRPTMLGQLVDLGFPFTLHEQGPFVARGTPAVTLTTAGERHPRPDGDTVDALAPARLGALGRSGQEILLALDAAADLARGTESYVHVGSLFVRGWALQFLLLAALLPFLVATVDLFARCRRRHVRLAPALRSLASRLGVWAWAGALFGIFVLAGRFPRGDGRPIDPDANVAGDWPVAALAVLAALSGLGWLVAHPRLAPGRPAGRPEEIGGHLAAMLVLGLVALVVAGTNPYALLFVLPSLHAWLWLPHVPRENAPLRLAVFAAGFLGPVVLIGSFAVRFELGWDAPWYLLALVATGYVAPPLLVATLVWAAVAGQVGALAVGRYAPYPAPHERPARGPLREAVRRTVLATRRRRRTAGTTEAPPPARDIDEA